MLTDAEKRRYKRHILLPEVGEEGQIKLKNSSVLVVGAGGLGAPVLQYLTASGIGRIGILDYDTVSEDNLHRQVLYGGHDLGKLKTIIANQRLSILNPLTDHVMINIELNNENAERIISEYNIIVDASDNYSTRYIIDDACKAAGKPWVFGSVFKYEGQVSVFNYRDKRSIRELYNDIQDKENIPDPSENGLFGVLPGIIGSFQAVEVIKIITGIGNVLSGKLLIYNMLEHSLHTVIF